MTIEEKNKLIAEFMGWTIKTRYHHLKARNVNEWVIPENIDNGLYTYIDGYLECLKEQFDTSWDWLMPVVIKMTSIPEYYTFRRSTHNGPYMEGNPLAIFSTTQVYDCNFTLKTLHEEVIEFINWYNTQKES